MATTSLAPGLARKIKKTLETRTETPEFLSSLAALSDIYGDNTPAERRRLRSTIEQHGLAIDAEVLAAAETVVASLDAMYADLEQLSVCCRRVGGSLASSKAKTADMLAESRRLRGTLETSEARSGLVQQFLQQYQLSHDEVYALKEEEIGERFFGALERVRLIHGNCRALLRGAHQRAGLELMDAMALHQEAAYERLCRWVQNECRGLGEADAPEVEPLLQRAAGALRARPVLFRYCAEEVAGARHGALFQRFIAALTRGGPGGTPRPIEMHAHDPRRYVGDMLAWVHQSLASERELLVSLFGDDRAAAADGEGGVVDMPSTAELLDRVFESICKPLKVRIEQVLASGPALLLCFRLAQLLGFYAETVAQLAGAGAALVAALYAAQSAAGRGFREQLAARAERLARHPPPPPSDLSPPPQVPEGMQQLLEVISAFESAYRSGDGAAAAAAAEFEAVLAAAVDPLVEMCERSAEALKSGAPSRADEGLHLAPAARRTYLINCLAALQAPLAQHNCSAGRADALGQGLEAHVAGLAGGHVEALLHRCRLHDLLGRIHFYQAHLTFLCPAPGGKVAEGTVMAADPALSLPRIQEAARAFLALVSDPVFLPEFEHLQVPRLKADASARVVRSLADAYEAVYQAVGDSQNGYIQVGQGCPLPHTPEQVRTILGVVT